MKLFAIAAFAMILSSFAPQDPPKAKSPEAQQEAFLTGLKAGEFAKAYETLLKGSLIEERQDQVANLREQTERGVTLYGGAVEWENMGIVRQEKHQAFGIGVLCCKKVPVYFYFVWYRSAEAAPWSLINVWFNDQTKEYWQLRK